MQPVSEKNKTLVFSVLYPNLNDTIIIDYINSFINQTDKRFDWLIVNDNAGDEQLHLFPDNIMWIHLTSSKSFGEIREIGISYAITNGYNFIIFSDMDDYYSGNRVELSKLYLENYDFVFSELQIVNMKKEIIHKNYLSILNIDKSPSGIQEILDQNYVGLSHSAVRTSALQEFEIPATIEVVDWWLFSILLMKRYTGFFMPEVNTFYRQDDENYVGVFKLLDKQRLARGIDVKLKHYGNFHEYCTKQKKLEMADLFLKKYQEMEALKEIIHDISFAEEYIKVINANFNRIYKGWWSEIISIEKWRQL